MAKTVQIDQVVLILAFALTIVSTAGLLLSVQWYLARGKRGRR